MAGPCHQFRSGAGGEGEVFPKKILVTNCNLISVSIVTVHQFTIYITQFRTLCPLQSKMNSLVHLKIHT